MTERVLDNWPATRLALRSQRRHLRLHLAAVSVGGAVQVAVLVAARSLVRHTSTPNWTASVADLALADLVLAIPAYVTGWIVPAAVAAHAARERVVGSWEVARLSRTTNADLWLSFALAPALPWFLVAAGLCWPYGWPDLTSGPVVNALGPYSRLHAIDLDSFRWGYPAVVFGSGAAFAALALICGFRARSVRQAVGLTVTIIAGVSYAGTGLSLATMALENWTLRSTFWYVWFAFNYEPATLLAPNWMLSITLSSMLFSSIGHGIVWITVGVLAALALLLGAVSFQIIRLARRPQR